MNKIRIYVYDSAGTTRRLSVEGGWCRSFINALPLFVNGSILGGEQSQRKSISNDQDTINGSFRKAGFGFIARHFHVPKHLQSRATSAKVGPHTIRTTIPRNLVLLSDTGPSPNGHCQNDHTGMSKSGQQEPNQDGNPWISSQFAQFVENKAIGQEGATPA